jgi:hypothetical protein
MGGVGLQWEGVEGSIGFFDANRDRQSNSMAAEFPENSQRGGLMVVVFPGGSVLLR